MDHVHQSKKGRIETGARTSEEIFPLVNEYDDVDDDETDSEMEDDYPYDYPENSLIWPCDSCIPNNPTGYTCPAPLPHPTPEQIQAEQARMPPGMTVSPPVRRCRRATLDLDRVGHMLVSKPNLSILLTKSFIII